MYYDHSLISILLYSWNTKTSHIYCFFSISYLYRAKNSEQTRLEMLMDIKVRRKWNGSVWKDKTTLKMLILSWLTKQENQFALLLRSEIFTWNTPTLLHKWECELVRHTLQCTVSVFKIWNLRARELLWLYVPFKNYAVKKRALEISMILNKC